MIEPNELSELMNTYLPIEYALSWLMSAISFIIAPWWFSLVTLSLGLYNLKLFLKDKDHKRHFMTKRDYPKKEFKRVENAFLFKSFIYGLVLLASLVYMVLMLCEWFRSFTKRSRTQI